MTTISEVLLFILEDMRGEEFKKFKWYLKEGVVNSFSSIPVCKLEKANREDTVDLMKDQYKQDAGKVAEEILRKMQQNSLAEQLQKKLLQVQNQSVVVDSTVSTTSHVPGAPGASGIQQTITAGESGKVSAPVISGGHFSGPTTFTFN
ncbi:caspase b [Salminus brasiliensis]|uniref:caspase b n=1 Tax=Salminus brasiliensis TaxID=930266 RepID=UPI003B832311